MSTIIGQFRNFKASARKALFNQFGLFPYDGEVGGYSFDHIVEAGVTLRSLALLAGDQDGVNREFTVRRSHPVITWNGQVLTENLDFTVESTLLTITVTFIIPPSADTILRELVNA